ncbi:hypothetical protein CRUP_001799, partial [Coryphaenoides rupestris]
LIPFVFQDVINFLSPEPMEGSDNEAAHTLLTIGNRSLQSFLAHIETHRHTLRPSQHILIRRAVPHTTTPTNLELCCWRTNPFCPHPP